jgi:hypothetical protein
MTYTTTGATVILYFYKDKTYATSIGSYYFSPGCSFRRQLVKDNSANIVQILGLDALGIGVPLTLSDTITLDGELTYTHNDKDPMDVMDETCSLFKKLSDSLGNTSTDGAAMISVATRFYRVMNSMVDYTVPLGGGPVKYTMQFGIIQ